MHKKNEPLIIPIIYCAKEKDEARDRRVSLNSWRVFCALSHVFEIMKSGLSSLKRSIMVFNWRCLLHKFYDSRVLTRANDEIPGSTYV